MVILTQYLIKINNMDKEELLPTKIEPYNEWKPITDPKSIKKFETKLG